jgi:ADP-ribose pyrophosphatase YjhB (NUDIX family)
MRDERAILERIQDLEREIGDAKELPVEVFKFVSRHTPLLCVDLLIQNDRRQTLMTWRDDVYFGHGWHFPGGIVRYGESLVEHSKKVARDELQADIQVDPVPVGFMEYFHRTRQDRGHQIVFLFRCHIESPPNPITRYEPDTFPKPGQWMWHGKAPHDLLPVQRSYAQILNWESMTSPTGACIEFPTYFDG